MAKKSTRKRDPLELYLSIEYSEQNGGYMVKLFLGENARDDEDAITLGQYDGDVSGAIDFAKKLYEDYKNGKSY